MVINECSVCGRMTQIVHFHFEHQYVLCRHCHQEAKSMQLGKQFVAIVSSAGNHPYQVDLKLHTFLKGLDSTVAQIFEQQLIDKYQTALAHSSTEQDSAKFTLSTDDSDLPQTSTLSFSKNRQSELIEKCKKGYEKLSQDMTPYKEQIGDRITKASVTIAQSTAGLRQKMGEWKEVYRNVSSDLPPLKRLAKESMKKGLNGLFSKIF